MEIHLHPADDENTAISPNNGAFLLNLTMPVVHFHIAICTGNFDELTFFK
jgi:hypothetical protein